MDSSSKSTFLLKIKRGVKWSDRLVELTADIFQYLNPSKFLINEKRIRN